MSPVVRICPTFLFLISTLCFAHAQNGASNQFVRSSKLDKRLSIARMADIYFANNNGNALLFINGEFRDMVDANSLGFYRTQLFRGDVIAIIAAARATHRGFIAQIVFVDGAPHSVTGISQWKAVAELPVLEARDWMKPSFLACSWPLAIPPKESTPVEAFPHGIGARYVWAHDNALTQNIYLRHKVDDEDCFGYSARATVFISGDDSFAFFHNGDLVQTSKDHRSHVEETREIKYGDVLAFKVKDDQGARYGLTVAISGLGQRIETGREGFKAVKAFPISSVPEAWTYKSYSSCTWSYAVNGTGRRATTLPNLIQATSIWALGAGEFDEIFVRYVVGGEVCETQEKPTAQDCKSHCLV